MKKFRSLALLGATAAVALPIAAAEADASHGHIRSFSHGQLTIFNAHLGKTVYIVNSHTDCGVSFGQSGDQIDCSSLGDSQYNSKVAHVKWTRNSANKRVATLVSVDMSGA